MCNRKDEKDAIIIQLKKIMNKKHMGKIPDLKPTKSDELTNWENMLIAERENGHDQGVIDRLEAKIKSLKMEALGELGTEAGVDKTEGAPRELFNKMEGLGRINKAGNPAEGIKTTTGGIPPTTTEGLPKKPTHIPDTRTLH